MGVAALRRALIMMIAVQIAGMVRSDASWQTIDAAFDNLAQRLQSQQRRVGVDTSWTNAGRNGTKTATPAGLARVAVSVSTMRASVQRPETCRNRWSRLRICVSLVRFQPGPSIQRR
jgi:hypothetical protein